MACVGNEDPTDRFEVGSSFVVWACIEGDLAISGGTVLGTAGARCSALGLCIPASGAELWEALKCCIMLLLSVKVMVQPGCRHSKRGPSSLSTLELEWAVLWCRIMLANNV